MDPPRDGCLVFQSVLAFLGVLVGLSGGLVFGFVYSNFQAALWAILSAVFSLHCLHLHAVVRYQTLFRWYSKRSLVVISVFAASFFVIAASFLGWYIYRASKHHFDFYPIEKSWPARAVMSFLTIKWCLTLSVTSLHYRKLAPMPVLYQSLNGDDVEDVDVLIHQ